MSFLRLIRPGKLARKLALHIVIFSSLIAIVITAIELSIEYKRDLGYIDERMLQIERSHLPSLIENLWVADRERLDTQLDGITHLPDFVLAEIHVGGKTLLQSGNAGAGRGVTRTFELWRKHRGQQQLIGELVVAASYDAAFQRTISRLAFFLGANALKTFLVVLFVFALFYRQIGRHIDYIARHADQAVDFSKLRPMALERREPLGGDEFSELVGALNGMQENLRRQQQALEQRVAELRIKDAAIASSINAIAIADLNGRISYVNQSYVRLWRLSGPEDAIDHMLVEFAENPDDAQAIVESLRKIGYWQGEMRARLHDGSPAIVQLSANIAMDGNGKPMCMMASFVDITERKSLETAFLKLNQELEQRVASRTLLLKSAKNEADRANAAKSEFLSHMSHELRTPLNAIIGYAELLEWNVQTPPTPDQLDNIREILRAGHHLLELINEVLDLTLVESGRIEISLEPVSVARLIDQCVALLQPLAAKNRIRISSAAGASAVLGDQQRLRQVLINLITNAIKYNRAGGSIEIDCHPVAENRLRIAVRDSGRGIAADDLPRLFVPFERIASADAAIEGTGIGLALCKRIIEAMGGTIGVESVPGEGSTFWIELPSAGVPA